MSEETMGNSTLDENTEDFATMLAGHSASAERLQPGQKVSGTVIAVTGDSVFVDMGIKTDGIMDRKDILDAEGRESVAAGDTLEAWVLAVSPQEIRLSRSMSGSGVAALEDARDAAIPVDGRVSGVCKGGYTVEVLGKTAFCPGSQMDGPADDAQAHVGRTLPFLVIRVENRGRNIVVSHRALRDRERRENLEKALASLVVGDTVEGRITRLAPYGAFMELAPFVEGMIHLSELSWSRVASADEVVSVGDAVRAKILDISRNDRGQVRIALSCKQAGGDPWLAVSERLAVGSVVAGRVVRLAPFGAFVELLPGVEGLVHISELSWVKRVARPEDVLAVGETVNVKIKDIATDSRRIALSLRDAEGDPWADAAQRFAVGTTITGTVESRTPFGVFVTLAPGVTGLLPAAVIKNARNASQLNKLDKGASITLVVQNIDPAAHRISLAPEGMEGLDAADAGAWKQHLAGAQSGTGPGMGIMAQALQTAMQKRKR